MNYELINLLVDLVIVVSLACVAWSAVRYTWHGRNMHKKIRYTRGLSSVEVVGEDAEVALHIAKTTLGEIE